MDKIFLQVHMSPSLQEEITHFPARSKVDLHVHSAWSSDGEYATTELFAAAKFLGISHLVLADHDTMDHIRGAFEAAKLFDINTMSALELSTVDDNRMVHVLAYDFDPNEDSALKEKISKISESRWEILPDIAGNLRKEGFFFEEDRVIELASGKAPVITNFAQAILEDERNLKNETLLPYRPGGAKSDVPSIRFISDYLVPGRKCHVEEYQIPLSVGISAIYEAGGVAVLAHPGQWFKSADQSKLEAWIARGLAGIEVYTPYHDTHTKEVFKKLCDTHHLLATGGSDFHSLERKPGHYLGGAEGTTVDVFDRLLGRYTQEIGESSVDNALLENTYKICVVDVDGTLVNDDHEVTSANQTAIKKLLSMGIPLVLMTARSLFDLRKITDCLALQEQLAITEGGGRIRYLSERKAILKENYLSPEALEHLFEIGKGLAVSPVVYIGDETFTENLDNPYLAVFEKSMQTKVQLSRDLNREVQGHSIGKVLFLSEPEKIIEIEETINREVEGHVYTSRSLPFALDIGATTKKEALIYVLDRLQIKPQECVVIGDSRGDAEAIRFAGLGVAMGNAPDEVKAVADYVAASNNESGVAEVINRVFY